MVPEKGDPNYIWPPPRITLYKFEGETSNIIKRFTAGKQVSQVVKIPRYPGYQFVRVTEEVLDEFLEAGWTESNLSFTPKDFK